MTTSQLIIIFSLMALGLLGSALFSGLETGSYCLNRVRLRIQAQSKNPNAKTLESLLTRKQSLLATLLIGNNISNYIGTAMLALILEEHYKLEPLPIVIINVMIITPLLFIFGETLPKNTFATHADKLMYPLSRFLRLCQLLFKYTGLLPLILKASNLAMRMIGSSKYTPITTHPARQVSSLLSEGLPQGIVTSTQTDLAQRVLTFSHLTLQDEMTPWTQVQTIALKQDATSLFKIANTSSHTRFPVLNNKKQPVGVINIYDAILHTQDNCPAIKELKTAVHTFTPETSARQALKEMQQKRIALAIVQNANGKPLGIITIKDLVEPITGDLVNW